MTLTAADLRSRARWHAAIVGSVLPLDEVADELERFAARLLRDACASCPDPGHKARLRYVADELDSQHSPGPTPEDVE